MSLFPTFPAQWTPVLPAAALGAKPVQVTIDGTRVALFRGDGGVGALLDRCPHRGVALSLGKVERGCLVCPFHGWEFGADGEARHVPLNPDIDRARLHATALPVRERGGLVWIFTGMEAVGEPVVPPALEDPGLAVWAHHEDWDCHWTRAMENMLDAPHVPYLHRYTIGNFVRPHLDRDSKMTLETEPTEHGFRVIQRIGERTTESLSWVRPNAMVLDIIPSGATLRMHVWCVPLGPDRTRMILVAANSFGRWNPVQPLMNLFNLRVLREDKAVVESSDPRAVPSPRDELNVPTDGPTLRFRTWYRRTLPPGPGVARPDDARPDDAREGSPNVVPLRPEAAAR